jgi:hypothetical protein
MIKIIITTQHLLSADLFEIQQAILSSSAQRGASSQTGQYAEWIGLRGIIKQKRRHGG